MAKSARVAITGLGVFCPIGCEPSAILAALREGRSGIGQVTRYASQHLRSKLAGEVADVELADEDPSLERTARMAVAAAKQAWNAAGISSDQYAAERVGLCVGASGAGLAHDSNDNVFSLRFQPHEQASAAASALGIKGPVVMFSSASAGSGLALVHGMNLLRSGRCDVVVAGGAECLSVVNHESMDTMRLCSVGPCSPFSGEAGLTVGEGSAFFVLERLDDALARKARVQVELFGFGVTQDAYDVVGGDPSGEGLASAINAALRASGEEAGAVDWIKANGTSNRDQDAAETLAIKEVFRQTPPVTALESFVGHANGAAPAIGLGLAVIAFQNSLLPATLNFSKPRAGCDLDYVPSRARMSDASCVLANSVGFGGSNVALLFGKPTMAKLSNHVEDTLCITGVGVVSGFGEGFQAFIEGLHTGASAIREVPKDRKSAGKQTLLQRFAIAAAAEAFESAELVSHRVGLFVGLTRGSAAARGQYAAALADPIARRTIGNCVLRMGRFTVASAVSQQFKLKGYGATISEGFGAGLHALAHACVHMESSPAEHALLVISADEIGPGTASSLAERNWLAAGHDGCYLRPYDAASKGTLLAEGAVALVVERTSVAESRGAKIRARIQGVGVNAGELSDAIREAMARAGTKSCEISRAYGNGNGVWPQDEAELNALRAVLPDETPIGCVNTGLGFAESTSGLFHVAASLDGLGRCLLTARTEGGRNAAVVLGL